jgi:3'-phosphoadenosine 5'-phosphosulfate sulfotransferase (PAPS reductase)/FAD synthetase
MHEKINKARKLINFANSQYGKGAVAFSGGKDGIVCAHLVNHIIPDIPMICETSFYYPEQLEDIKAIAKMLRLNVTYVCSLSDEWLNRNKQMIFSSDKAVRSRSFSVRQQASIKKFGKSINAGVTYTGRRTEENTVKNELYSTKENGMQCHPIRDWKEEEVWQYFKMFNIPPPWIYSTEHGKTEGNSPFYSINPKYHNNNLNRCWQIVENTSPKQDFTNKFR